MTNYTMTGKKVFVTTRKANTYGEKRVCTHNKCDIIISKYNKNDTCFYHSPKTHGRVRGWKPPE